MLRTLMIVLAVLLLPAAAHSQQFESPWSEARLHPADVGAYRAPRGYRVRQPLDIRTSSQILAEAQRYVGMGKVTRYAGAWCRDFVNLVAARAGYRLANNSRRAVDALHLGVRVSSPQPGDLVVMRHHVTIYAGHDGGRIVGLGGNQGRRVRYSHYSQRRVLAFVRL